MSRELVKKAAERNKSAKLNREAGMPEVGTWFLIDGKLVADSLPWRDAPLCDGRREGKNDPASFFATLKRFMPGLKNHDYTDFPHGRVMYDEQAREFVCYVANSSIMDSAINQAVIQEFRLPSANTKFVQDAPLHRRT